ncbi:hypothetical protein BS78_06G072400 [Paspalum vaginatum]|nr:hypothetical protein BS78_06G072400 [Paspalum vaginatum]
MGGDERGTTATPVPIDQRGRVLGDQALLQQPRQPQPPHPRLRPVMQQPPQGGAALPPQGFIGAGMPSPQGIGSLASAAATQAQAEEAARTRAAEQMAFEDAWKALNPDFRTPFASVEDAVSRLLPYHVFADYEEEDDVIDSSVTENSSTQKWEDDMGARVEVLMEHFEKQVLSFNVMTQHRAAGLTRTEERLLLERALHEDERRQVERLNAVIAQHQQREHQEAAARARQALAQAQAAGAWPAVQPAALWQALAAAAVRGEGGSYGQAALAPAPAVAMQQQQQQHETMMTAGTWQALAAAAASRSEGGSNGQALVQAVMMQHMQRQRQQHQEEMMAAASRGEGALGGHAAMMQFMQQQNQQRQHEEMVAAASRAEVAPGEIALAPATLLRQLQQQQQRLEAMAAGGWQMGGRQMYAATRGDGGSTSSQAAFAHALLQQPGAGQEQGQASNAAAGKALPWRGSAEGR